MIQVHPLDLGTRFRIERSPNWLLEERRGIYFVVVCVDKNPFIGGRSYLYSFSPWGGGIKYYQSGPTEMHHLETGP